LAFDGYPVPVHSGGVSKRKKVEEITFTVERDEDGTGYVASWDDPSGKGGITTEGADLRELQEMILDAATGYFQTAGVPAPSRVRLHFVTDPELALA
jgi:hypothetical protein